MALAKKKVLVAGASGLIGSHLTARLLEEGALIRATWHSKRPIVQDERIEYLQCDLTQRDACRAAVKDMEYVFLCAASTHGAATITSTPMVHVTPNVLMNSQMLEAAYEASVRKFLFLGSTVGYPPRDRPIKEDEMFDGDPYEKYYFAGWTKRFSEILCRMYGEKLSRRMTTIVLRPTNVYGPNDRFDFATSHVIPALIRKIVERWDPLEVWGTGDDVRDAIYVSDMIDAMILAIDKLEGYRTINIGFGQGYTVKEFVRTLLELDDYTHARICFDPSKPTTIPFRLVDTSQAERELGFKAQVSLKEGLARTLAWYRQQAA